MGRNKRKKPFCIRLTYVWKLEDYRSKIIGDSGWHKNCYVSHISKISTEFCYYFLFLIFHMLREK